MSDPVLTVPEAEGESTDAPERGASIGRFLVLGSLGAGGMGVVLSAYDPQLDRKVALKLLRGDLWKDGRAAAGHAALLGEAKAMARLQHPNVVAVHEVAFVDETAYVVMEQVEGRTLRAWLNEAPRGWREVVDMLAQAGAGLAAAHHGGLVHRDFKPDNVLVGLDGRPRVSDFGLAFAAGSGAGTREYMAPEQAAGHPVDARADQHAFCVTAWEAIHGERPGPDRAPPRERRAPPWLVQALTRGLSARPDDRWSSMDALLRALRPRASRWSWALIATAVAATVAAAFVIGKQSRPSAPTCADAAALIAPLWDRAARDRVAGAFDRTGRASAGATFSRVDAALRGRLAAWARVHQDACEATTVRHEQSDTMLDRRMRCLGQARAEIAALVTLLSDADAAALDRAAQAAGDVGRGTIDDCSDVTGLAQLAPLPKEPAAALAVASLREDLARLDALRLVGKWRELLAVGPGVIARARAVGYAPVLAEALLAVGRMEVANGDVDRGIAQLYEAVRWGSEANDDLVVAPALGELTFALGSRKARYEASDVALQLAFAAAARAGNGTRLLRQIYNYWGHVLVKRDDNKSAIFVRLLVYAIAAADRGLDSHEAGMSLGYVAGAINDLGHPRDARPLYDRALAITAKAIGVDHPWYLALLSNAAGNRRDAGDADGAAAIYGELIATKERDLGADDPGVADECERLARLRLEQGRLDDAEPLAERALRIRTAKLKPQNPKLADVELILGVIAQKQGKPVDALARYDRALALQVAAYGADHARLVDTYTSRASVLLVLGRAAEAHADAARAVAIDDKSLAKDDPERAGAYQVMGDVLAAEGQKAEADAFHERARKR